MESLDQVATCPFSINVRDHILVVNRSLVTYLKMYAFSGTMYPEKRGIPPPAFGALYRSLALSRLGRIRS